MLAWTVCPIDKVQTYYPSSKRGKNWIGKRMSSVWCADLMLLMSGNQVRFICNEWQFFLLHLYISVIEFPFFLALCTQACLPECYSLLIYFVRLMQQLIWQTNWHQITGSLHECIIDRYKPVFLYCRSNVIRQSCKGLDT